MMKNRNVIETISRMDLTKKELIEMIERNFPDNEVGTHGTIAEITNTTMTDGTIMQGIMFGKVMK